MTCLIYGLGMLEIRCKLWKSNPELKGRGAIFHIDDASEIETVVNGIAKVMEIRAKTHLECHRFSQHGATPRFEWVSSKRNITDLPTRMATAPYQ